MECLDIQADSLDICTDVCISRGALYDARQTVQISKEVV